jgi:AbrB family looped-hinge helix DNA binding protein
METARLTDNGQVTIPTDIRKKLSLKAGDNVAFIEKDGNIILLNSNRMAFEEYQQGMKGAAEEAGFLNEQDVVDYVKQIRREIWSETHDSDV